MIYILLLEKNKYYIGYTARRDGERFQEHFEGGGAKWTQKYKPVIVLEWREGTEQDENDVTLELMEKHGWTNVRGGKWCQVEMVKPPKELLARMGVTSRSAAKRTCARCGHNNHTEEACYATKHFKGYSLPALNKRHVPVEKSSAYSESQSPHCEEINSALVLRQSLYELSVNGTMTVRLSTNLSASDLSFLQAVMNTNAEAIEVCYLRNPYNFNRISERDTFLVVTNLRVFRSEARIIHQALLRDISRVSQERNWLSNDVMHCTLHSGGMVSFPIQESQSCDYLCRYIQQRIPPPVRKQPMGAVVPAKWEYIRLPENMTGEELMRISQMIQRGKSERIELIYLANPAATITPGVSKLACITSARLVKYEMGMIQQVPVKELIDVQHEYNFIRWDNVVCFLKNGAQERVGIYDSFSCELFCLYLKEVMAR